MVSLWGYRNIVYTMKTTSTRFAKFGVMKLVHRRRGDGQLQFPGSLWSSGNCCYFHSNWSGRTTKAKVTVEGFGVNGIIVSIIFGNFGSIGEIITCESTGRTIIWCLKDYSPIIRVGSGTPPMAARYQAVQIAALNWFTTQTWRTK